MAYTAPLIADLAFSGLPSRTRSRNTRHGRLKPIVTALDSAATHRGPSLCVNQMQLPAQIVAGYASGMSNPTLNTHGRTRHKTVVIGGERWSLVEARRHRAELEKLPGAKAAFKEVDRLTEVRREWARNYAKRKRAAAATK